MSGWARAGAGLHDVVRAAAIAGPALGLLGDEAEIAVSQCFVGSTLVHVTTGTVAIRDVRKGDVVLTFDTASGHQTTETVLRTFSHVAPRLVAVHFGDDVVTCTLEHPFLGENGNWISAGTLTTGTLLSSVNGGCQATGIDLVEKPAVVYNFEVDKTHTYAVGQSAVWVHNACMSPDQRALKELVDEATNGARKPLGRQDAETVLDWAKQYNYPGTRAKLGDVSSPSNWNANPVPHIHLDGIGSGHIPVESGVVPRP